MKLRSQKIVHFSEDTKRIRKNNVVVLKKSNSSEYLLKRKENNHQKREIKLIVIRNKKPIRMTEHVTKINPLKMEGNMSENWKVFKRDFNIYLIAAELMAKSELIKINLLLNLAGTEAIEIFETLELSDADKLIYNNVVKAFDQHFGQTTNIVYERFVFFQRKRAL